MDRAKAQTYRFVVGVRGSSLPFEKPPRQGWGSAGVLALLVAAGTIKSSPAMSWLPIDLTGIAAALIGLRILNVVLGAAWKRSTLSWGWVFGAALFASLGLVNPAVSSYAEAKRPALLILTLGAAFVGGLWLVRTKQQRYALAWGTVATGLVVAGLAVYAPSTMSAQTNELALSGGATIGPARILGAAAVVTLAFAITRRGSLIVALPATVGLLALMLYTGSRGPLVGVAVAATAMLLLVPNGRLRALAAVGVAAVAGARIFFGAASTVQERILQLLSGDKGASVRVRQALWETTWDSIEIRPLGWGALARTLNPVSDYPHNILLEVAAEGGVIAGIMFVAALVAAAASAGRAARTTDPSALMMLGLLGFWFTNALVSGDLNDNRGLFVLLGACLAMGSRSGGAVSVAAEGNQRDRREGSLTSTDLIGPRPDRRR